ncbi:Werner helicase interacting protein 1 [Arthrobotrys megalospora]
MKNLGYGKEYKYPPNYVDGIVKQEYLPESLVGKKFLEDIDLGTKIDEEAYEGLEAEGFE